MNDHEFVSIWILQDYCLGLLSAELEREVEAICLANPKILSELHLLNHVLERYACLHKSAPRIELREIVWKAIFNTSNENE